MHIVPQNILGNPAGDWIRSQVFARRSTSALIGQFASLFVPYYIAASETFTVPEYKQALFTMPITVDGAMVVDGYLVEV